MVTHKEHIITTFPQISLIGSEGLRDGVIQVYSRILDLAGVHDLSSMPFTMTYGTDIRFPVHIRAVTDLAIAMAKELEDRGIGVQMDILVAGALLHDAGKILEFSKEKGTYTGPLIKHTFTGAAIAQEVGLPPEVLHCIIYHSYEGEGRRRSVESVIVHHCDLIHFETVRTMDQV